MNLQRNNHPEIRRHILMLLNALSSESRKHLQKKWSLELNQTKTKMCLLLTANSISSSEQSLNLESSQFDSKCLQIMSGPRRELDLESFVREVYGIGFDEHAFQRVRIAINRLNKRLSRITGFAKSLSLNRNKVSLHPEIEISIHAKG